VLSRKSSQEMVAADFMKWDNWEELLNGIKSQDQTFSKVNKQ